MLPYPELNSSAFSIPTMVALQRRAGVVLVRNFFNPEELLCLRLIGNFAYGIGDAILELERDEDVPASLEAGLRTFGWIPWIVVINWAKRFHLDECVGLMSILDEVRGLASAGFGGENVKLLQTVSTFRRLRKGSFHGVGWHRDSAGVKTSPFGHSLNVWIPFVDVGIDAPSLDLILGSHEFMQNVPGPPEAELEYLTDDWVLERLSSLTRWTPDCRAGDVLIFDHNVVHRTQPLTEALVERMALELRWSPN